MFTTKYQSYVPCPEQPVDGSTHYNRYEQVIGPFAFISQEMDQGYVVVHAHREDGAPGMTWGPIKDDPGALQQIRLPRPTLWVMNEAGATVAKYDL